MGMVCSAGIYIPGDLQICRALSHWIQPGVGGCAKWPPEIHSSLCCSVIAFRPCKQKPCNVSAVPSSPAEKAVNRLLRTFLLVLLTWGINFRLGVVSFILHCCLGVVCPPYLVLVPREWNQELIRCNQGFLNMEGLNVTSVWWFSFVQN